MEAYETTEVLICGGGPTGAMLSALLGQMSVSNIVLEREPHITTDPRGIALDEDGIRLLQKIGVYDQIYTEIGSCMGKFNFVGGVHNDLSTKPFMAMDYSTSEGGTGHVGFICHKQPKLEKAIRSAIEQSSYSTLRPNSTLISISEDDEMVEVHYSDAAGKTKKVRARYLVGADGKTGFTRKKYLEPKGVKLERCSQTSYEETWVALNWQISLPSRETHPEFPLWDLGYSSEDVYDLFFPKEFRFLCNPRRPAVCGRFGTSADRLWRFEFVVRKDEDGMEMAKPQSINSIILPYLTHPGSRYGLSVSSVQFPVDCITTLRSRPFTFSARSCNKWALGRVILAGDAAHVFPPFGGQGIASGFRDASSLAWRLAVLCRSPGSVNHTELLKAWYAERKQQLERSLAATIENGAYVTEEDPLKVFVRDWFLWLLQLIPSGKRWLEKGARRDGMVKYEYQDGMVFLPGMGGGICFPQVYCALVNDQMQETVQFTDDVIFAPQKRALFQIVVLVDRPDEISLAAGMLKDTDMFSHGYTSAEEATYIVQDSQLRPIGDTKFSSTRHCIARLATGSEFAADSRLCGNRPAPQYYDMYRMKKEVRGRRFVILRPDAFVYAACADREELQIALRSISTVLGDRA